LAANERVRCGWSTSLPIYVQYHDEEWGVPVRDDDVRLFEFLTLEGAQAGLSWLTILRKRENYRTAFDNFDPAVVARYDDAKIAALLTDAGIVRNRLKINAAVVNARKVLDVQEEFGSFSNYLWGFVDGQPIQNHWESLAHLPAETELSRKLSKDLARRGFKFVGSTIVYSLMQAVGMVNDHTVDCFRHDEVARL
jgi:DNA-3-methyladenine glycosylase I